MHSDISLIRFYFIHITAMDFKNRMLQNAQKKRVYFPIKDLFYVGGHLGRYCTTVFYLYCPSHSQWYILGFKAVSLRKLKESLLITYWLISCITNNILAKLLSVLFLTNCIIFASFEIICPEDNVTRPWQFQGQFLVLTICHRRQCENSFRWAL